MRTPIGMVARGLLLVVSCLSMTIQASAQAPAGGATSAVGRDIERGDQSNVDARREAVVRTQKEWAALWREHNFERPAPRVDFRKEMVAAIFLGSQTTAGHAVRIVESATVGDGLVIRYRIDRPAVGAAAAQVLTFPYHIVAMPARTGAVRFERVE